MLCPPEDILGFSPIQENKRIDNKYYDPEADWAGWMTGVYGYSSYPIRHYVKKVYNFRK